MSRSTSMRTPRPMAQQDADSRQIETYSCGHTIVGPRLSSADQDASDRRASHLGRNDRPHRGRHRPRSRMRHPCPVRLTNRANSSTRRSMNRSRRAIHLRTGRAIRPNRTERDSAMRERALELRLVHRRAPLDTRRFRFVVQLSIASDRPSPCASGDLRVVTTRCRRATSGWLFALSPARARALFTVRAAISSDTSSELPSFLEALLDVLVLAFPLLVPRVLRHHDLLVRRMAGSSSSYPRGPWSCV